MCFDVHRLQTTGALVLECQADTLAHFNTRVVAPLFAKSGRRDLVGRLHPEFEIDGEAHVLAPQLLATLPVRELGPPVGSLRDHDHTILNALDMLISGY